MIEHNSYSVNGKLYVNTLFLCELWNRTDKQIGRYKKDGMPSVEKKPKELNKSGNWYILYDVIEWHRTNVNQAKSNNSKGLTNNEDIDLENEEAMFNIYTKGNAQQKRRLLLRLPQNRLDDYKKIEDIVEKEAKNKEYDSKYALIEKVKKGQQELASMFVSMLKTSMAVLSKDLENKEQDEIYHLLDRHFKKEIDKLNRFIGVEEDDEVSLSEVTQGIIEAVAYRGIKMIDIVKHLEEM